MSNNNENNSNNNKQPNNRDRINAIANIIWSCLNALFMFFHGS